MANVGTVLTLGLATGETDSSFVLLGFGIGEAIADTGAGWPTDKGRRRRYILPDGEQTYDWHEAQDLYQRYLARQESELAEQAPKESVEATARFEALTETSAMFREYPEPISVPKKARKRRQGVDVQVLLRLMEQDEEDAIVALLLT